MRDASILALRASIRRARFRGYVARTPGFRQSPDSRATALAAAEAKRQRRRERNQRIARGATSA